MAVEPARRGRRDDWTIPQWRATVGDTATCSEDPSGVRSELSAAGALDRPRDEGWSRSAKPLREREEHSAGNQLHQLGVVRDNVVFDVLTTLLAE